MNRALLFSLIILFTIVNALGQTVNLLPHIGVSQEPQTTDSICDITPYIDPLELYEQNGLQVGDTVPDFTLYTIDGTAVTLSEELDKGFPVLLFSGSYTCPVVRHNMPRFNELIEDAAGRVTPILVYIVEPHPIVDNSPYSDTIWEHNMNDLHEVWYRQATTYGERLEAAEDMDSAVAIDATMVIDGPCNEWWINYGEAPNRAYLINVDGTVFASQGWLYVEEMKPLMRDLLDSLGLLNNPIPGNEIPDFSVELSPNPTSTSFQLSWVQPTAGTLRYAVSTINGKQLLQSGSHHFSQGHHTLQVGHLGFLPPGFYLVEMQINGHFISRKFSISR